MPFQKISPLFFIFTFSCLGWNSILYSDPNPTSLLGGPSKLLQGSIIIERKDPNGNIQSFSLECRDNCVLQKRASLGNKKNVISLSSSSRARGLITAFFQHIPKEWVEEKKQEVSSPERNRNLAFSKPSLDSSLNQNPKGIHSVSFAALTEKRATKGEILISEMAALNPSKVKILEAIWKLEHALELEAR